MGKYTVTEAQYTTVVGKNLDHAKGSHFPASFVTWRDANEFCTILNDRLQSSLTLPTETQWEYACRAGAKNTFVAEDANAELDAVAWYGKNSGGRTHPVGGKMPNAFGLFDMRGNVLQWCKDVYADDQSQLSEANINSPKTRCAMRGAPFCGSSFSCRASHRMTSSLKNSGPHIGFRVVLSAPSSKTSP
jgi:formylglycine-generating enzyme required for sulfatase activity